MIAAVVLFAMPLLPLEGPRVGRTPAPHELRPTADAWRFTGVGAVRGVTLGPIESRRHPNRGYGSEACERALDDAKALGANWVSLTPFGRVHDLTPEGIVNELEIPFEENRAAVVKTVRDAHDRGLKVMLVPHLWVESGEWRALIDPGSDTGWEAWAGAYREFILTWADVAAESGADLLSIGVELRSWVTTPRVELMRPIIADIRERYRGLLTYSSNWDDAEMTLLWDAVDLVGINGFYPLVHADDLPRELLAVGGVGVGVILDRLAQELRKPVLLTEIGYTARPNPAVRPWEWPEALSDVKVDEVAQADAYRALIGPLTYTSSVAGFFVWRYFADPDSWTEERAWGFTPRGRLAELVLRDAFTARFAADGGAYLPGDFAGRHRARSPWRYGWESSPPLFD